jgi:hypothetical protein
MSTRTNGSPGGPYDPATVPVLALYLAVLIVFARLFYINEFWGFAADLRSVRYSYLEVVLFSILVVMALAIRDGAISVTRRVPPLRVFSALLLSLMAMLLYVVSFLEPTYQLHLRMLSFLVLAWGLMTLLFRFDNVLGVVPFISIVALIPLPESILDNVSIMLSKHVGRIVASISSATYSATPLGTFLRVPTPSGTAVLEITFACSGILSLASVLGIAPITAYLAARPPAHALRKIGAFLVSIAIAVATVFLGQCSSRMAGRQRV